MKHSDVTIGADAPDESDDANHAPVANGSGPRCLYTACSVRRTEEFVLDSEASVYGGYTHGMLLNVVIR